MSDKSYNIANLLMTFVVFVQYGMMSNNKYQEHNEVIKSKTMVVAVSRLASFKLQISTIKV